MADRFHTLSAEIIRNIVLNTGHVRNLTAIDHMLEPIHIEEEKKDIDEYADMPDLYDEDTMTNVSNMEEMLSRMSPERPVMRRQPGRRLQRNQTTFLEVQTIVKDVVIEAVTHDLKKHKWISLLSDGVKGIPFGYNETLEVRWKGGTVHVTPLALSLLFFHPTNWIKHTNKKRIRYEKKKCHEFGVNTLWFVLWEQDNLVWNRLALNSYTKLKHNNNGIQWWAILSEMALYTHPSAISKFTNVLFSYPMTIPSQTASMYGVWERVMESRGSIGLSKWIVPRPRKQDCDSLFQTYLVYKGKTPPWKHLPWKTIFIRLSIRHTQYGHWFPLKDKINYIHHLCRHVYYNPRTCAIPFRTSSIFSCSHHLSKCGFFETIQTMYDKQVFYFTFFPKLKGLNTVQDINTITTTMKCTTFKYWIHAYLNIDTTKHFFMDNSEIARVFLNFWKSKIEMSPEAITILHWSNCINENTGTMRLDALCKLAHDQGSTISDILKLDTKIQVTPDMKHQFNIKRLTLLKSPFVSPLMKRVLWQNTHYMYDVTGHYTWRTYSNVLHVDKMIFDNITIRNMSQPVSLDERGIVIYYDRQHRKIDFSKLLQMEFMESNARPPRHMLQNSVTILFAKEIGIGEGVRQEVLQCVWDDAIKDGLFMWGDEDESHLIPSPGDFPEERLYNIGRLTALCIHQGLFIPYRLHNDFWTTLCSCIKNPNILQSSIKLFPERWKECQEMYKDISKSDLIISFGLDEKEACDDKDTIMKKLSLPSTKTVKSFCRGWNTSLPGTFINEFKGEWNDMFCEKLWNGGESEQEFEAYFTYKDNDLNELVKHVYKLNITEQKQFFFFVTGKKRPPLITRGESTISIHTQYQQQVRSATCSSQLFIPDIIPIDAAAIIAATTGDYNDGFAVQ